jgi:uncharacterized protein DUF5691
VPVSAGPSASPFTAGEVLKGEVVFYPSAAPLRGQLATREAAASGDIPWPALPAGLHTPLSAYDTALARQPWLERWPLAAAQLRLERMTARQLVLAANDGIALPIERGQTDDLLPLVGALHLGRPVRSAARRGYRHRALARGMTMGAMMGELISSHELDRLRQALFLGLARQPLAAPERLQALLAAGPDREPALAVLALAGQRQRFERPAVARSGDGVPEAARRLHDDPRAIVAEPARRLLLRLANGAEKAMADTVVRAAVRRVLRAGFRLHPFNLPRLIGHIKGDARCLGLAERAYLALAETPGEADAPSLLHGEITAENWTEFPKGHRVGFLREQRRKDPAAARVLLEGVFKSETAAARADLLGALDIGLGADDLLFLESVASDRSEAVRELVARLIANVPGTAAYAARLAEAAQCFARPASGVSRILSRVGLANAAVVFTPPKGATQAERRTALVALFDGFSVAEIAAAAGLAVDEIVAALPPDEHAVSTAFFNRAARDGDEETMVRLELAHLDAEKPSSLLSLHEIALHLSRPISAEAGKRLLGSAAWRAVLERRKDDGTLTWTAAVLPPERLPELQDAIAALPPVATRAARDFSDLMLALDALQPPQR